MKLRTKNYTTRIDWINNDGVFEVGIKFWYATIDPYPRWRLDKLGGLSFEIGLGPAVFSIWTNKQPKIEQT